jgi:peptide/nickel transport system substrate-binding protein
MNRPKPVFRLFILLVISSLFGVTVHAQDARSKLTIGTTYIIDVLNPTTSLYGYAPKGLYYETLVEAADGNNVMPGLAESWSVSDDGLIWTFKIREGVKFSDGTPCTAVEAAWTLNWYIENSAPAIISYLDNIASIEAPDATTLKITVTQPVPNMISAKLLYAYILPPSVWESVPADEIATYDDPKAAVGSGPYVMSDFKPGEYMILDAVPNYWRGPAPVDQIVFRQYTNEDSLVQALQVGEVDYVYGVPFTGVPALQNDTNIKIDSALANKWSELTVNMAPDGTEPESLRDPVIREAIDLAVDREQIINVAYLGYGKPGNAFITLGMGIYHNTKIGDIPFDIVKANQLLDDAGYKDTNGDGIREYKDGTPLEYRLMSDDTSSANFRIIQIISDGLSQIGISAPPTVESTDSLVARQKDFDYDLVHWEWDTDADPHFLSSVFTCAETQDGGWNDSGFCSPEYDKLFQEQATALNQDARKEAVWKMQEIIAKERPWLILAYTDSIAAYRKDRFTFDPLNAVATLKWALYTGFSRVNA